AHILVSLTRHLILDLLRTALKHGFLEWKFANEGDDLTVLGVDEGNPEGGIRDLNADNYNQIETIQCTD
ncbi:hypothetical protein ACLBPA_29705, partial [Klebsiella pneumoniae]|uniref:hypothetical protein n=1 Tax=Klebsiella pneumoniae TaxID=573 RepID=UPI0039699BD7